MSRRSATLLTSAVLLVVLAIAALLFPVPYTALTPGPTFNTLGTVDGHDVIQVQGRHTYPTKGHLNMVTVDETLPNYRMSLFGALRDWWSDQALVVPKDTVYPPGQSLSQSNELDMAQFYDSQDAATVAAMAALGIKPKAIDTVVDSVGSGTPAAHILQPGDIINTIDGVKVTSPTETVSLIRGRKPGQVVDFGITRDGKSLHEKVTTGTTTQNGKTYAFVGFVPSTKHVYPVSVNFQLADVGGPSAGMMFALGIIEKLSPHDITGGRFIAGTGTIDDNGSVGPIGGIQMKTIAARDAGATIFLTPSANCAAAKQGTPKGLRLVKVNSLTDALNALRVLRTGHGALPSC